MVADRIIDRLLRRFEASRSLDTDLVCVVDHPVLAEASERLDHAGEPWRFVRVKGELGLRHALLEQGRVVAALPPLLHLPFDLRARTWLNRPLEVRAEDVVAGLSERSCAPIVQEEVARAVLASFPLLKQRLELWTLPGGQVTERELRSVLIAATLGTDQRLGRESLQQVLTRWLVHGVPTIPVPGLWREAFREAYPEGGEWLAWASEHKRLESLITAGALANSPGGREKAPRIPGVSTERDWRILADGVERALEGVRAEAPERVTQLLAEAEGVLIQLRLPPAQASAHRLLRSALDACLHQFAWSAAQGQPVDEADIGLLRRNFHVETSRPAIELVESLSRLSRFTGALAALPESLTLDQWFELGAKDVAFADGELLAVRRRLERVSADLQTPARQVLEQVRAVRERLNRRFAQLLASQWSEVSARQDVRRPLPLHRVSRGLIRRLVEDGRRVLLLLLDGCDMASFHALMDALPEGVGLSLPNLPVGALRDDLAVTGPLLTGISLVPTVTSHARRALFAGEIPGNEALDEADAVASNASGDKRAWQENPSLEGIPHTLLLKGELASSDDALLKALSHASKVLAVVVNAIDDALSSKEETPLPLWRWDMLGRGLLEVLKAAVDAHWTVLVTSDHGHTPHWDVRGKRLPRARGQRFGLEPVEGAVRFEGPRVPGGPLYLLTEPGAWHGTQRRGYHGGAGLEEIVVPIAFLGPVRPGEGRCIRPRWWLGPGEIQLRETSPLGERIPRADEGTSLRAKVSSALEAQLRADAVPVFGALGSDDGSAHRTEEKPTEEKRTEVNRTEENRTEVKRTEVKRAEVKRAEEKPTEAHPKGVELGANLVPTAGVQAGVQERRVTRGDGGFSQEVVEALKSEVLGLQLLELLKEYQVLMAEQLAKRLNVKALVVRGTLSRVMNLLTQKGIPVPFSGSDRGDGMEYRWKIGS